MRKRTSLLLFLLAPALALAAPNPKLALPSFTALAQKATESVTITLDPGLLGLAAKFLDSSDPQDAATKEVLKGLLAAPGWNRLVETRSRKTHADVDIYIMLDHNQAIGLALIASEPRQFTIVNIVGAIDLDKLHKLEGQFGVPKLDIDPSKAAQAPQK
jgi:hypothetical protein